MLVTTLALVAVAGVGLVCLSNARTFADENEPEEESVAVTEETIDIMINDDSDSDEATVSVIPEYTAEDATVTENANAPETTSSDASVYEIRNNNILGISVPVYVDARIDAELNIPQGTKVEEHPDLAQYLAPGEPLSSDSYCIYYKNMPSRDDVLKYIEAIKASGFTEEAAVCHEIVFTAYNNDGCGCIVEYNEECSIFRVSFFKVVDGFNTFARLG
ncbi:hypothetical protein SAMN02910456_02414 [Ruminococcaceae bacterium YRB3002]|nr:hypothetical protein SAMN02910456_02414 [Ruminococcaceae bacterium YRB3002]